MAERALAVTGSVAILFVGILASPFLGQRVDAVAKGTALQDDQAVALPAPGPVKAPVSELDRLRSELGLDSFVAQSVGTHEAAGLAAPPEPLVPPHIPDLAQIDADRNRLDDRIDNVLRQIKAAAAAEGQPDRAAAIQALLVEPVRVELVFSRQVTQNQLDAFVASGGNVEYIYRAVSYGWNATVPLNVIEALPQQMGDSLLVVIADRPAKLHLDEATRTGRVRAVWASGFAGSPSGFSGSSTTTIGILDTGIDDSHTDLAGRMEYWKDWTTDNEPTPRDIIGHGSHVTGIACGTGDAQGSDPNLHYTFTGDMTYLPSGYYFLDALHLPNGQSITFSSTAWWTGGGSAYLRHRYRANGSTGAPTTINSAFGSSPLSLTSTFTGSSSNHYMATLTQNGFITSFAIASSVTYSGVGDGFQTFRGVAPGCRWAGGKVFLNDGTGTSLDIGEAVDDMVVQRMTHNIKIANMSLGIIGDPGIETSLRGKVNTMVSNGIVAVVSAGNDGPGTTGANQVDDPGRAAFAITVAAGNDINQLTQYTSSGFSSPGTDEDYKPDVMAPGGSLYYSAILSVDTNDADGEDPAFADKQANDYANMMGTSMASPFVCGAAALVIQALEQSGLTWSYSSNSHPLLVKMLLCATATESNAPREVGSGTDPTLGRAASPKDLYEGYGLINPDAAIEAATLSYSSGTISDSTAGGYFDRRAWARKVSLTSGTPASLSLSVPPTADFDLYLYSGTPDSKGNPVILASSTTAGNDANEAINYTPGSTQTAYLVIKRISGNGSWTLSGDVVPHYTLTLTCDPNDGGTIDIDATPPPDPNGKYLQGTLVTLTANKAEGFAFASWSGDASEPNNPIQVIMDGDKNITGTFGYPGRTLALNVAHNAWGRVDVYPWHFDFCFVQDTSVRLTGIPIPGKAFKEYTIYDPNHPGDLLYATRSSNPVLDLTMDADRQVDADFKCGSGVDQALPLLTLSLGMGMLVVWVSRRRR